MLWTVSTCTIGVLTITAIYFFWVRRLPKQHTNSLS